MWNRIVQSQIDGTASAHWTLYQTGDETSVLACDLTRIKSLSVTLSHEAKNRVAAAENADSSKDTEQTRIFVNDKIVEKLSQPWNHFACGESIGGRCKLSESVQICFYDPDMLIVMGFPLKFSEDELPMMNRLQKWITNCDASLKENAVRVAELRRKVRIPFPKQNGAMNTTDIFTLMSIIALSSVQLLVLW
ncbi:hypothetical protein KIN20_028258 [Parelaphostrongylus tenuis]|uniref:Uncharacterized protein n=1 Tax=Parelaphostrongylus tenuis TaxID=148309 RepID=A0AAD5WEV5_PARTN|nr:hypothetical protein KIN20_028258 [Parelaphostrongylus tenuis]